MNLLVVVAVLALGLVYTEFILFFMFFYFSAWLFRFSFKGKVVMISGSTCKDMCTARGLEAMMD